MTHQRLAVLAASVLALGVVGTAGAKTISYEVNGKRYTYESTSRREIAAARKVIEAANAADRANAAAKEERARNPLVAVIGSETQRAAATAQANLERVLADHEQTEAASAGLSLKSDQQPDATARSAEPKPSARDTAKSKTTTSRESSTKQASEDPEARSDDAATPAVRSSHFDPASGIRTTFMADGSIREELADPTALSRQDPPESGSATASHQAKDPSPEETTGSTTQRKPNQ